MIKVNTDKLLRTRIALGMNISEVAELSGVSRWTIARLEQGVAKGVFASTLQRIATTYGIDAEELLER